jgi:formamidopyrimidine-DNA glycosylase
MPELPEVEAARKLAHEHCAGKKITKVVCEDDETVIQVSPETVEIRNFSAKN